MLVDIAGRVNNLQLPLTQPFIPLFECLVNSIEAIEEANIADGRIDVHVERDISQGTLPGPSAEETNFSPIRNISVIDNGRGFDDGNTRAFFLSDSTGKVTRGNKGIGRFTWLKVFDKAVVDSVFHDGDAWTWRTFDFVKTTNGVENEQVVPSPTTNRKTIVKLTGLRLEYQKHFPKSLETIGHKVIDHLLIHFVSGSCPKITLHDDNGQAINLNHMFAEEAKLRSQDLEFKIREQRFKAKILRFQSGSEKHHTFSYCANQREVLEWKAAKAMPEFGARFSDEQGQPFVFKMYVSGSYLDARVNSERTDFMFLQETDLEFPGEMTRNELDAEVAKILSTLAEPYTKALQLEKRQTIEQFVQHKAPQYRYVLNERHSERLAKIPPNLTEEQLDVELYKTQQDIEVGHRKLAAQIQAPPPESATAALEYQVLYDQYLDDENELGKAALAKYVVHRRTILEMLDSALKLQTSGSYAREDFVHRLIYPMQRTSDDVKFDKQNLWVVDERLAYHWHLASDLPISQLKVVNANGGDEPDLVIFNTPRAFSDTRSPYQSIVIVEFKRPERNEYPLKEEDPVDQVLRYVKKIKDGLARDRDGKTLNVGAVPFYGYILCSLTPRIRAIAESRDFVKTPDNEGYFQYHKHSGCYIEILSYDKVLVDAKKRNRSFFDRLQIPML